jgi:hypothetical protein
VICRDEKRQYVWQPLEQKATASKDVIRRSSADSAPIDMPAIASTKETEAVTTSNRTEDQQPAIEEL